MQYSYDVSIIVNEWKADPSYSLGLTAARQDAVEDHCRVCLIERAQPGGAFPQPVHPR
jgi:hypothetical protein